VSAKRLEYESRATSTTRHDHESHVEVLVAAACRLAASDSGVRSVRVLTPSRPTYDELRCYQEWAHDRRVRLHVDGKGVITVRAEMGSEG
jgi:hypothetical protein